MCDSKCHPEGAADPKEEMSIDYVLHWTKVVTYIYKQIRTSVLFLFIHDFTVIYTLISTVYIMTLNPIQYGLFLKHYSMGGPLWPPCNFGVS